MDLAKLKQIAPQLDAELDSVFAKYGLKVRQRRATVDPALGLVKFSIETADVALKTKSGEQTTPEREAFKRGAWIVGLKPEHLDRTFVMQGTEYKVAGLRPKASKNAVLIKRTKDGKQFVCSAHHVLRALEGDAAADNAIEGAWEARVS
jgi:hypothetical protein